jgi:hypothetical protein
MVDTTINVRSPKTGRSIEFSRDFGDSLEQSAEMFGAEIVHGIFVSQAVIRSQSAARALLDKEDMSAEQAIEAGGTYTPGAARKAAGSKKDPVAILAGKVKSGELSREDLLALLEAKLAE